MKALAALLILLAPSSVALAQSCPTTNKLCATKDLGEDAFGTGTNNTLSATKQLGEGQIVPGASSTMAATKQLGEGQIVPGASSTMAATKQNSYAVLTAITSRPRVILVQ